MKLPVLKLENSILRPWKPGDVLPLVRHANNPRIASNLRDGFPHPYTRSDAGKWLEMVADNREDMILAIEVNGEASGGIGIHAFKDVYRYNGEIGYWLSERFWGRGIMTEAVGALVDYAFSNTSWLRLFACIFANNPPSMRVLEKNGFKAESIHRKAVIKEGVLMDEHLFALLKNQWKESREV